AGGEEAKPAAGKPQCDTHVFGLRRRRGQWFAERWNGRGRGQALTPSDSGRRTTHLRFSARPGTVRATFTVPGELHCRAGGGRYRGALCPALPGGNSGGNLQLAALRDPGDWRSAAADGADAASVEGGV